MEGTELRSIRQRLGLTQGELARAVGVASNTVARWERGELSMSDSAALRLEEIAAVGRAGSAVTRPNGFVRDPYHKAILDRIQGYLDPDVFEACAVELVRRDGWSVVPVRGGKDDGFDGAVADGVGEPFPLVVTTSKDLVRNLKQSLKAAQRGGWNAKRAIFATSRGISGATRRKLYNAAQEVGIPLVQTYDRDWFANRLYENPSWCSRLLELTGRPRALSVFPRTQRPVLGDAVLGRERDMQWLLSRHGDCLLIGGPASGKTFLLRSLALQGDALFLVDGDREGIANDLRELQPSAVIVDDAHVQTVLIETLAQVRQEVGAPQVRIIATSWPDQARAVCNVLQIAKKDVCELDLLDADTIVEVIKSVGVQGPDQLLAIIRQQAAGRPGLAATLARLCAAGDVKQVVNGEALLDQLVPGLDRLMGADVKRLLAPFALGGDSGVTQDRVAQYLGASTFDISSKIAGLAAAGIVREMPRRAMNEPAAISVEPIPMRWALVRDIFFGGPGSLDYRPLLEGVSSRYDMVKTLIGARSHGALIPGLLSHVEDIGSASLWSEYALIGPLETQYVIDNHPELILDIAQPALMRMPETVIPKLLDNVRREHYEFGFQYRGAIKELERWAVHISPTVEVEEVLSRRSTLVRATERWWRDTQEHVIAIHMMCIALKPGLDYSSLDPGAGMTLRVVRGTYPAPMLERLTELWPTVMSVLSRAEVVPCHDLFDLVRTWLYEDQDCPSPEETRAVMLAFGERMLRDIADSTRKHPGVQHLLRNQFSRHYPDLDLILDPDFEAIYPMPLSYSVKEHIKAADRLAVRLSEQTIEDVAELLGRVHAEARFASFNVSGSVLSTACKRLADGVPDPLAAAEIFIDRGLPGDVVQPFLLKAAADDCPGWAGLVFRCLNEHPYEQPAVSTIITHPNPPSNLLSAAILKSGNMVETVEELCCAGQVNDAVLQELFRSDDTLVASAAAIGHWFAQARGRMGEPHGELWRHTILRATFGQSGRTQLSHYWLGEILSNDGVLATDWLLAGLGRGENWSFFEDEGIVRKALSAMSFRQRRMVLRALPVRTAWPPEALARVLVDEDSDLYRELLESPDLAGYHLSPLAGKPNDVWGTKAMLALDAGYSVSRIVSATTAAGTSWAGEASKMWAEWGAAFEQLQGKSNSDTRVLDIARLGIEIMGKYEQEAEERERYQAVHGS